MAPCIGGRAESSSLLAVNSSARRTPPTRALTPSTGPRMTTDGSSLPTPPLDAAPLQFDAPVPSGETAAPQAMSCDACGQPIQAVYYETAGQVICARCRGKLESRIGTSGKGGRMLRAFGLGLVGAIAGAVIYYAITAATGYSIGLVAILVGFLVGKGVFIGSAQRGGRGYQVLAVGLTYFAIASTYIPLARDAMKEKIAARGHSTSAATPKANLAATTADSTPSAADSVDASAEEKAVADSAPAKAAAKAPAKAVKLGVGGLLLAIAAGIVLCAALPVIAGFGSPITLLITGFALVQAWRMNRKIALEVTGPYRLAPPTPEAAA